MLRWLLKLFTLGFGRGDAARKPVVEELEPRILYSADANPLLWGGTDPNGTAIVAPVDNTGSSVQTVDATTQQQQRREIVFIDAAVQDAQTLIDGLIAARPAGTAIEVVQLSAGSDGLRQIGEVLAQESGLDAVHIVSHGDDAVLQLGSTRVDGNALEQRGAEFAAWREALGADADLLLYGCDVARGDAGVAFIERLAQLTGADVAASTDATGATALGGDWVLEAEVGTIESHLLLASHLEQSWNSLLTLTPQGGETRVNSNTTATQGTTAYGGGNVAMDSAGNYVVVFNDNRTTTGDIYFQRYNAAGTAQGSNTLANSYTSSVQDSAQVAMDSSGNFVVTWTSVSQDGSGYGIYAQRFNASGVAQGSEFRVNTATLGNQVDPTVAMSSGGVFVVAWTDSQTFDVCAQRYNASGVAQGSQFRVNATASAGAGYASSAMDGSGNFVIAWESAQAGDLNLYGQRYNASGVAQGSEFLVNTTTTGSQSNTAVAMDSSGNFVVVWDAATQDAGTAGIYAQRFNASGVAQGSEFRVNTTSADNQEVPAVAMNASGGFVVSWKSNLQDGSGWGVYAQEYNASGVAQGSETRIATTTTSDQVDPSVAYVGSNVVVAWKGNGTGDASGVFMQRYSVPAGITVTPTVGLLTTEAGGTAQFTVVLNSAPTGNVTIAVSSSDTTEGTVSTALLTFTSGNWSTPQFVTVTGVNDALADGFQGYTIVLAAATSSDGSYNGLNAADVQAANSDDDINYGLIAVDTSADTADGDTSSLAALAANRGADGAISLREAIIAANNTANGAGGADRIHFNIAGTGTHTITPLAALPTITGAVVIDASTDDSFAVNGSRPAIILDGNSLAADGLTLSATADGSTIRGLVIRDFGGDGIEIQAGSDNHLIAGNYIGRLTSGGADAGGGKGNDGSGINMAGANNTIGGTTAADVNVISGNADNGIAIVGGSGNVVLGNTVGLNAAQTVAIGNINQGVWLGVGATGNTIGGTASGAANTIGGSTYAGIEINGVGTSNNTVAGNTIGTNASFAAGLGNGNGINIKLGATNNLIGGAASGAGNVIVNSATGNGVAVTTTSTGNAVLGNRIRSNFSQGIDLAWDGITANDANDADTGPNGLQNFPVLTSAASASAGTTVVGTLASNANTTYRIEFFGNRPGVADSTNGEGDRYLGFTTVTTNGSGNATINTLLANAWVNGGDKVSATATVDLGGGNYGSTSEFAVNVTATASGVIVVDTSSDSYDSGVASASVTIATLGGNRGGDGRISLREAIYAANNTAGTDKIVFSIDGTGIHTISVASLLPDITSAVVIDASTDDSFGVQGNRPAVVLDGANAVQDGLRLYGGSGGSTVRGLVIQRFTQDGIDIAGSNGNTVVGNWLGLNAAGTGAAGNQQGLNIFSSNATVVGGTSAADRNVLSGNTGQGIILAGTATGTLVQGNYIGTNASGTAAVANSVAGIYMQAAGNTVGGTAAGAGNLISGNGSVGIAMIGAIASGNFVQGNWIGLNAAGTGLIGNGNDGVYIVDGASNNTIGGATTAHRNVISGNSDGVQIGGTAGSNGNIVQNNYIGTDSTGTVDLGNNDDGVDIDNGANNNQVLNNLIAGNTGDGIDLGDAGASTDTIIRSNLIGTQANGTSALGNSGHGILIGNGGTANSTAIGGTTAGQGNTIAFNSGDGIFVSQSTSVSILGNSIHSNSGLAIDLGTDGVTANDTGDADTGANNLQNSPVLATARTDGSTQLILTGSLNSSANSYYRIEFFANTSQDGTGYGEGQTYLGFANVAADGSGNATIGITLAVNLPVGTFISATATKSDVTYTTFTDTSEFARNIAAVSSTQAVITVDTAGDTSDGDTTSLSTLLANKGGDGFVSLREAIIAANNTANGTSADRITFGIAGTGTHTITLASALPTITGAVVIDATTDDSFGANANRPAVILDGNDLAATNGLVLTGSADGSTIRGLVIRNFTGDAIRILAGSDGNTVAGNYIGSYDASGANAGASFANGSGLYVLGANNTIGGLTVADRNLIGGNSGNGVGLYQAAATGNLVAGNLIGLAGDGSTVMANGWGARVLDGASGNTIGGSSAAARNVIAGSTAGGVQIGGGGGSSNNNVVQGNYIGTDATGALDRGNAAAGVLVNNTNSGNQITGNLISGNDGDGISLANAATGVLVRGNTIGLNAAGSSALGNGANGIAIASANNTIGGATVADRNIISGNASTGVYVNGASGNTIEGNYIGTDAAGAADRGNSFAGVHLAGAGNVVRANVISGNNTNGILVQGDAADNNQILGNRIGTNAAGTAAIGNTEDGIHINLGADGTVIGGTTAADRNLISGNVEDGIELGNNGTTGTLILGNYLGTNAAGSAALGNGRYGVVLYDGVSGTVVGGTAAGAGNLISGNTSHGIVIDGNSNAATTNNAIQGNLIGTNAAGSGAIGNGGDGIYVFAGAVNTTIGGTAAAARNVISGNNGYGVRVNSSTGLVIQGNTIGLNAAGTAALGNQNDGIGLIGVSGALIGGTTAGARNVISGNLNSGNLADAIWISGGSGNTVQGNYIGTAADGVTAIGNFNAGIDINDSANNLIGGTAAGAGNVIAYNQVGVLITHGAGTTGNAVLGNSIVGNTSLGIDLGTTAGYTANGVTANDAGDADSGPNNLQNFPVLTSARTDGSSQIVLSGTLDSTASSWYRIEFFASTAADASGNGEGQRYIGFANVATDGAGNATISVTLSATVAAGEFISATATRSDSSYSSFTDTSEFAANCVATAAPVVTTSGATLAYTENGAATAVDSALTVSDADSTNLTGAVITISANYAFGQDVLAFTNQLGITGSWNAGSGVLTLTGTTTVANYQTALRTITYVNTSDAPSTATRTVSFTVADTTGSSAAATRNVSVTAVNDAPTLGNGTLAAVNEDTASPAGQAITTIFSGQFADADSGASFAGIAVVGNSANAGTQGVWQYSSNSGSSWFAIGTVADGATALAIGSGSLIRFVPAPDYNGTPPALTVRGLDNSYAGSFSTTAGSETRATVNTSSNGGTTPIAAAAATLSTSITAVNDAPLITSNGAGPTAAVSVAENTTAVTTVTLSDVDGGTAVYSIVAGGDGAQFTIDVSTGALSFITAPDFEAPTDIGGNNVYDVTVQVSDGAGGADTQAIAVTVTDVSNTLVVTTAADNNDTGLGSSFTIEQLNASRGSDNAVSLREAMIAANTTAGTDTIGFAIAGTGVHTINVTSALPTITGAVILDASSDDSFAANGNRPAIVLDGNDLGGDGLVLGSTADGSTIRGFVIRDFGGDGIQIDAGSTGNTIAGNWIGRLDASGADAGAAEAIGGIGINVLGAGNTIGGSTAADRNVLSGSTNNGLSLAGNGNLAIGNYLGLTADGTAVLANGNNNIYVIGSSNTIGGPTAGQGNVSSGSPYAGIFITGGSGNVVQGNRIGTNAAGTAALGNAALGIEVWASNNNTIGGTAAGAGNLISGNGGTGLFINDSTGTVVQGNVIGLGADGSTVIANAGVGIAINSAGNTVGGTAVGARNVVSGNSGSAGILIYSGAATGNVVQGNYVGTDSSGGLGRGNALQGIAVWGGASGNLIGGTTAAARNVLAGNGDNGIAFADAGTSGNVVQGNWIGINAAGTATLGNGSQGIWIGLGASGNTVGGSAFGAGNVVGGNSYAGIELRYAGTSGNVVQGNWVGTDAAGVQNFGNGGAGVFIQGGAGGNLVGGTAAGAGNTIRFNGSSGIVVSDTASTGNALLGNRISSNTLLGIDIGSYDGVTPNDSGDGDSGANNLQNFPLLGSANTSGGNTTITGSFNSAASTTYRIEFFSSPTGDASGYGEGQTYLGFATVTTDASGNAAIAAVLSGANVSAGHVVSATATMDLGSGNYGDTSEFAANVACTAAAPGVSVGAISGNTTEGGATATFTVVLNTAPTADVTIAVSSNNTLEGTVSTALLTFTSANWNIAQTVTVTGINETIVDGNRAYTVVLGAASSADGAYNGLNPSDVALTNTDNDTQSTIVVTTAADTSDGDTSSLYNLLANRGADGEISLREAIIAANNSANGSGGADRIHFNLSGVGVQTIAATSGLPVLADAAVIDGASQPGFSGTPLVRIDGALAGVGVTGITFGAGSDGSQLRNVMITRFAGNGVDLNSTGNVVAGNYIGNDGSGALGNGGDGIYVARGGNTIGGAGIAEGNVISGNTGNGIYFIGPNADGNTVQGNRIGVDATGSVALANQGYGLSLISSAGNLIGGTSAGAGNVISANGLDGVLLFGGGSFGNVVQGNFIGTDQGGTLPMGNGWRFGSNGVYIDAAAHDNLIGGVVAGAGNIIAFNAGPGVATSSNAGGANALLGNVMRGNGALAIDLGGDGVTANDSGDADSGANDLQNFPVLYEAVTDGSTITIRGAIDSSANTTYRLEFFSNALGSVDPTGHGEGQTFLFAVDVTTDASGHADFNLAPVAAGVAVGDRVGATATVKLGANLYGSTSEFSMNVPATSSNIAPAGSNGTINVIEDTAYTFTVADFGYSDVDNDGLLLVWFDSLPAQGTLLWNGSAFAAGNYVSANDIVAGLLTYQPAADNNGAGAASFAFRVQDNGGTTGGGSDTDASANTITIDIAAVNDAPVVTAGGTLNTNENSAATPLAPALTVSDVDSATISGATVRFTVAYANGQDVLVFTDQLGISGIWDASSGTLTLSGAASVADYQTALRSVTYVNSSEDPSIAIRTVEFVVNDGVANSAPATRQIQVVSINDAPTTGNASATGAEDAASIAITLSGGDVDGTVDRFRLATLPANGTLYLDAGLTTAAATGIDYAASGQSLTLYFVPNAQWSGVTSFQFAARDAQGAIDATPATATLTVTAVNDAPSGAPVMTGSAVEDQTLTADTASIADADGLGAFSYQWQRGGVDIAGATGSTYTLGDADVGASIRVIVSYTDGGGTAESLTSAAVGPIANVNDAPSGAPVVTGTATEDQTLTADTSSIADADGLGAFSYQWQRDGVAIGGATGSAYTLGDADVGAAISVVVSYTDGNGTAESLTSAAVGPVANINDAPSGAPVVTGAAAEDQTLAADTSSIADADGLGPFSYQWQRNGVAIGGATGSTYTLSDSDVGANISVVVSYTDGNATAESLTSAAVGPVANVNDAPGGAPLVTGTATEDQTLSADTSAITDADGLGAFSYQWQRNGVNVVGATAATYTLGDADVGATIGVVVSYTDGHGAVESMASAAVGPVANVNDAPVITSDGGGTSASLTVAENQSAVTTVASADVDGAAPSYSIAGGADAARFAIDAAAGTLRFTAAPDFEAPSDADRDNVYELMVAVADGNGGSALQSIAVAVTGVNEAPVNILPSAVSLAEQAPAGTVVAIVTASDPDAGDLFTFTLVNDGAGRFVVDPSSGRLQVAPGAVLDFESAPSHTLILRVTDAQGLRTEQAIVVTLRDVAEPVGDIDWPDMTPPPAPAPVPAPTPIPTADVPAITPLVSNPSNDDARGGGREFTASRLTPSIDGVAADAQAERVQLQRGRSALEGGPVLVASVSFAFEAVGTGDWSAGSLDAMLMQRLGDGPAQRSGLFMMRGSSIEAESGDEAMRSAHRGAEQAVLAALQDPVRVASATLTAGFVWWLTRSGGLLTSILMGIPAWRHVDLLPVLAPARDDDDEDDDGAADADSQHGEARVTQRDSLLDDLFSNTSRLFGESRYMN